MYYYYLASSETNELFNTDCGLFCYVKNVNHLNLVLAFFLQCKTIFLDLTYPRHLTFINPFLTILLKYHKTKAVYTQFYFKL